jgi:hypothetical protein
MKSAYKYSVVRFVPDPIRGETINLGLIMGSLDSPWFRAGWLGSYAKIQALGGKTATTYAQALVRDLESSVHQDGNQGRLFHREGPPLAVVLRNLGPGDRSGMLDFSSPLTILTAEPDATFDSLFTQLVSRERRKRQPPVTAPTTREQIRRTFKDRALNAWDMDPARITEGGITGRIRHPVDFGLYNEQLRAVVHTVSFAGDLTHAVLQRAVVSEAALDLGSKGTPRIAMLYSPAPRNDDAAREVERASVQFVKLHGIEPISVANLDDAAELVQSVARHR